MKQNMGIIDRALRTLAAFGIVGAFFLGYLEGTVGYVLLGVSAVLLATSAVGVCPAYLPIKLSTKSEG